MQTCRFSPERNFAENLLALTCAFIAFRNSLKYLSMRHIDPPKKGGQHVEAFIEQNLVEYAASRRLSPRETEILRLILLGKDNQNIATELSLAPGTVKVHVHHILQKTQMANRQKAYPRLLELHVAKRVPLPALLVVGGFLAEVPVVLPALRSS